ncbi:MAG: NACHT domain-containing protein [Bacteroidota bacterium]
MPNNISQNSFFSLILSKLAVDIPTLLVIIVGYIKRKGILKAVKSFFIKQPLDSNYLMGFNQYIKTPVNELPKESDVFYKRIKDLFESKYNTLNLIYNAQHSVLFGNYEEGYTTTTFIIYCYKSNLNKTIETISLDQNINNLKKVFCKKGTPYLFYCVIENGQFSGEPISDVIFKTETDLIDGLINFNRYLEELVYQFENAPLPFSDRTVTIKSLHNVFILPEFYVSDNKKVQKSDLEDFIAKWLQEESNRHIALLGDYGMGKTSLMRYLAYDLAKKCLRNENVRIPIFISLTNTSPMHGGMLSRIKEFVSENLGVSYSSFEKLLQKGKLLFLLDGFDELGFIGTKEQRFKQLDAIWQLAFEKNKIIVSGRPGYFPTEFELLASLRINEDNPDSKFSEEPYAERITLALFNDVLILRTIDQYFEGNPQKSKYRTYYSKSPILQQLCKRPSMLHIIIQMLPELFNENPSFISESTILNKYIQRLAKHWIERQNVKKIISVIENPNVKQELIIKVFTQLVGKNYKDSFGNISITAKDILSTLKECLGPEQIVKEEDLIDLQTEILSGYFLQRVNNEYTFMHKSFYEYFVALKALQVFQARDFKSPILLQYWTTPIRNYINETIEVKEAVDKRNQIAASYPAVFLLIYKSQTMAIITYRLFRLKCVLAHFFIDGFMFVGIIIGPIIYALSKLPGSYKYLIISVIVLTALYSNSLELTERIKSYSIKFSKFIFYRKRENIISKAFILEIDREKKNKNSNLIYTSVPKYLSYIYNYTL